MTTTTTTQRRCPLCRDWMPQAANFCGTCGERLAKIASPPDPPAEPSPPSRARLGMMILGAAAGLVLLVGSLLPKGEPEMPVMPDGKPAVAVHAYGPYGAVWIGADGRRWTRSDAGDRLIPLDGG